MRVHYREVLRRVAHTKKLGGFPSMVIGTPPLDLATQDSDIDIAFQADDLDQFQRNAASAFGDLPCYSHHFASKRGERYLCVQFQTLGWDVELFCQSIPLDQQWGVRHFHMERRLLDLNPPMRQLVLQLKHQGMKTEPAFAAVLGLAGDPYEAILLLESLSDKELRGLVDGCKRTPSI